MEQAVSVANLRLTPPYGLDPTATSSPHQQIQRSVDSRAKRYARANPFLSIASAVLVFSLTLLLVTSGATTIIEDAVRRVTDYGYLVLLLFVASVWMTTGVLLLPLQLTSSYFLEHAYGFSNQTIPAWIGERVKGLMLSTVLVAPVLLFFYYALRTLGNLWWLPAATLLCVIQLLVMRIVPTFIFPLFYKFKSLEEGDLKQAVRQTAVTVGVPIEGVYVVNLSKNTKKANATFTGRGGSRRVILGDTLVANLTDDEIFAVFAHELAHYKLKHMWVGFTVSVAATFLTLFLVAQLYVASIGWFGLTSPEQIAALPVAALWLGVLSLVTTPFGNFISRAQEHAADRWGVKMSGNKKAFANVLAKVARISIADPLPHPLVEFLFHRHPSLSKRIAFVQQLPGS